MDGSPMGMHPLMSPFSNPLGPIEVGIININTFKVETTNRFTSLMSKPVHPCSELDLSPEPGKPGGGGIGGDLGRRGSMPGGGAGFGAGFQVCIGPKNT